MEVGFFANLSVEIERHQELHVPEQFRQVLEKYLSSTSVRPHERNKEVTIVDSTRDWPKPHFTEGIKISSFALRLLFP